MDRTLHIFAVIPWLTIHLRNMLHFDISKCFQVGSINWGWPVSLEVAPLWMAWASLPLPNAARHTEKTVVGRHHFLTMTLARQKYVVPNDYRYAYYWRGQCYFGHLTRGWTSTWAGTSVCFWREHTVSVDEELILREEVYNHLSHLRCLVLMILCQSWQR